MKDRLILSAVKAAAILSTLLALSAGCSLLQPSNPRDPSSPTVLEERLVKVERGLETVSASTSAAPGLGTISAISAGLATIVGGVVTILHRRNGNGSPPGGVA